MTNRTRFEKAIAKAAEFHAMMQELCKKGNIVVEYGEDGLNFDAFLAYCRFFEVNPNGGAITMDAKAQVLYVD